MAEFNLSLYDDEFFAWHLKHAREYSIKTMDWFIEKYKPESVIDFGCGIGSYLESAQNHGLEIAGVEISENAKKFTPKSLHRWIIYNDCTKQIEIKWGVDGMMIQKVFDCVISFETAEHIDPKGTDQFILNLVNATGKWLLFTAAPPGQEGCGHINMQPKQYWIDKFMEHSTDLNLNTQMADFIATKWRELGAPEYICNNLIVFER